MKSLSQIILLLFSYLLCLAQPTGHQKIFFEITDDGELLDFRTHFMGNNFGSKKHLKYKNYNLSDESTNPTGFAHYPYYQYIHKTLMTDNHIIEIVRNRRDTMRIEILKAFNVYFLHIAFQEGNYRIIVNDGPRNKWALNTLPIKKINEQMVYDITPADWSPFRLNPTNLQANYTIATNFKKQGLLAQSVLPEDDPNFKNPRRMNHLLLEVGDYNFDGQKDYREHKWNNDKEWNYFIYADSTRGIILDSFMSALNILEFDFEKKIFKAQTKTSKNVAISTYQFVDGKPTIRNEPTSKPDNRNQEPKRVHNERVRSIQTYEVNPFRFELERNCPGVELPPIDDFYSNKITVYDKLDNTLKYTVVVVGNKMKESEGCSDSLQIADYNFDDIPDFRICNNSVPDKHTYYVYHPQRQTFLIEQNLSELNSLKFDFQNKTASGYTGRKQFTSTTTEFNKPFYTEQLRFEGRALENLTVTTTMEESGAVTTEKCKYLKQKRIYEGDTIGLKLLNKKPLIRKVQGFKFEMQFNPEDKKTGGEKGAYVRLLTIYHNDRSWGPYEISGNYLREVPHWLDSLEIADYNFDGYPDIRIYLSEINNGRYSYLIYNPENENSTSAFYSDTYYSLARDLEYIPNRKMLKGSFTDANQITYFVLRNDTLTLTKQDMDLTKPPFIEESIYRYGQRRTLRSAYGSLDPVIKKEYGDYNFDGNEDFRQQKRKSPYNWDVFIYNPQKEAYEIDTLLSKFNYFNYNKNEMKLDGYIQLNEGETTRIIHYYQWSFSTREMVLYQKKVCYAMHAFSESYRCVVSKLVDGQWIETQVFGAE